MNSIRTHLLRLFIVLTLFLPSLSFAETRCEDLLTKIEGSYPYYAKRAEENRGNFKEKHPEFLNPQKEKLLAQLWQGELGPETLNMLLPEGVTFVAHQLRKAGTPGVVKLESGDLVILRVEMPFDGKVIGTNVTLNAQSLFKNLERSIKGEPLWLVGPEAKAALDWGHGGGTKTTGGHTADTLLNSMAKYDVFTVGMDQPWHGEGAREWFKDANTYFRYRVAFRNRFIHPDVPTFLVGHSKGGLVADMAVRRTGEGFEDIGLDKAYVGFIPLSFVPDVMPEGTFKDKTIVERQKDINQKAEHVMCRMNPGDRDLFANLVAEDKTSALSGLFCSFLSVFSNWSSTHKPTVPSLYVMGEHDALYLLSEEKIEEYVRNLGNSSLWTYSARVNFRGEVENVGHLIFDHYMPKKDHEEAFQVMVDYMTSKKLIEGPVESKEAIQALFKEKVLDRFNAENPKLHLNAYSDLTAVNAYASTRVLVAYQWIPEFREFLDQRVEAQAGDQDLGKFKKSYFLNYTDQGVFETYAIIKNFVAEVLKERGVELEEVNPKERLDQMKQANDPLANQREAIINFYRVYANNLAFREFLKDFVYYDSSATEEFESLNHVAQALAIRLKEVTKLEKNKGLSDEERLEQFKALGSLVDENGNEIDAADIARMREVSERIQAIRNKKWIPDGELHDFAQANVQRQVELAPQIKELDHKKIALKKELDQLRLQVHRKENQFNHAASQQESPALLAHNEKQEQMFKTLESFDLKQRELIEPFIAKGLEEGKNFDEIFATLPQDMLNLFEKTEEASQNYQRVLSEGQLLLEKEALEGRLGEEVLAQAQELYGPGGLKEQLDKMTLEFAQLEYEQIAPMKHELEVLIYEYVEEVVPEYFHINKIRVWNMLDKRPSSMEDLSQQFKYAKEALAQWKNRILSSKQEGGDTSLY
ncbi:MAG TPA: hypothetical protein DCL41_04600 [Bdellovibrionales bacterium]|nr:hypothetical protein [Bdellovibrionales bacterium]